MMRDPELKEMGEEEYHLLKDKLVELEEKLQIELLGFMTPDDSRSVFLEIRA